MKPEKLDRRLAQGVYGFSFIFYLLNLDAIHAIRAITTTIRIIAVQKPALKIPSTNSQEVRVIERAKAEINVTENLFIVTV